MRMTTRARARDEQDVYRPLVARVLLGTAAAVGVWWVVDLLLRQRFGVALLVLLWLVAALAALGALFWRPAVVVDGEGAELRNVFRDVRVPWSVLTDIETRYSLTLVVTGRRYASWAAPASGRPPRRRPSDVGPGVEPDVEAVAASSHTRSPSGAAAFLVAERWDTWRRARDPRTLGTPGEPGTTAGPQATAGPEATAGPGVVVRWRPLLPVVALGSALAALLLTPLLG